MKQQDALALMKMGHSVYVTGVAGSGKTHTLTHFIEYLKTHGVVVAVTATTGIAATHIGGMTIHSWSGIGVKESLSKWDLDVLLQKQYLYTRITRTNTLVIDEISMLHAAQLDMVDTICKACKRDTRPFGGMQVILCGDFFQLPPVSRTGSQHFAYESDAWKNLQPRICYLEEQYRHKDSLLRAVLASIREGEVSEDTIVHLRNRARVFPDTSVEPTVLHTHSVDVDRINAEYLSKIQSPAHTYTMKATGNKNIVEQLIKGCLSPEELVLKKGAQVMFTKNNHDGTYMNGTRGVVIDFDTGGMPIIQTTTGATCTATPITWEIEEEGKVRARIVQVPLRLAWAMTVHKSQGMSLDAVECDLSHAFEPGMGYVALSRARSMDSVCVRGFNEMALRVAPHVRVFDKKLKALSSVAVHQIRESGSDSVIEAQKHFLKQYGRLKQVKKSTYDETKEMLKDGYSVHEIAQARKLTVGTIISHIEKLMGRGDRVPIEHICPAPSVIQGVKKALKGIARPTLGALKKKLPSYSYADIRLARLYLSSGEMLSL